MGNENEEPWGKFVQMVKEKRARCGILKKCIPDGGAYVLRIRVLEGGNARKIFKNVFLHFLEIDAGDHIDLPEFGVSVACCRTEGFPRTSLLKCTLARATPQAHHGHTASTPGTKAYRHAQSRGAIYVICT